MANIIVLGAGMVGRAIAADLARTHVVTAADIDAAALERLQTIQGLSTVRFDISDREDLARHVAEFDLVIGAVPGFMGYATLQTVIEAGRNVVDISFCPEDTLELDPLAREHGVTALVDMGVAPGMSNLILGYHDGAMQVERFECMVGGLPRVRTWPFEYKAPFSPLDVIEEYMRPARLVVNGKQVARPALSDLQRVHFNGVGTLEAFNTDGLRSLIRTMPHIPNMTEKTLRYPGHVHLIETLKAAGFFRAEKIRIGEHELSPRVFTSSVLIDQWKLGPTEEELVVMRVVVSGREDGRHRRYTYELFDQYDAATETAAMSRTTGYACTAAANLILNGAFTDPGLYPPERVGGKDSCFEYIIRYLAERQVHYHVKQESEEEHE